MKSGYKNIYIVKTHWCIRMERRGVRYMIYIPIGNDRTASLKRAIAERNRLYTIHGLSAPRSNTGITGISEVPRWHKNRCTMVFSVTHGREKHNRRRHFPFIGESQRLRALRAAVAHRARLAGEDPKQLMSQAFFL